MNIERLNWDSDFFNLKIGKIVLDKRNTPVFSNVRTLLDNSDFDLIYIFSKNKIKELEAVDRKITYICEIPNCVTNDKSIVDYTDDPDSLYDLAYQSGHKSRFNIDPNISDYDFRRLYRLWIDNSINKTFADYIKVYMQDGKPLGFITAKNYTDKIQIGLIAVNTTVRGKGIGKNLINSIMAIAKEHHLPVEVATQADNIGACRFYESNGFSILDQCYIYHYWTKSKK